MAATLLEVCTSGGPRGVKWILCLRGEPRHSAPWPDEASDRLAHHMRIPLTELLFTHSDVDLISRGTGPRYKKVI